MMLALVNNLKMWFKTCERWKKNINILGFIKKWEGKRQTVSPLWNIFVNKKMYVEYIENYYNSMNRKLTTNFFKWTKYLNYKGKYTDCK